MSLKSEGGILADPSKRGLSVWLSTFEKCWLRSKYQGIYDYEQKLMSSKLNKKKKKRRGSLRKLKAIRKVPKDLSNYKENPITVIKAGELDVNIVEATGVPHSKVTAQYSYCKFYVTNNDPCYGDKNIYVTPHQKDQSPKWNMQQILTVTNTTGKFVIELWEEKISKFGEDEIIGKLEIELNDLVLHSCCNDKVDSARDNSNDMNDWFQVTLLKGKDKQKNQSNAAEKAHSPRRIHQPDSICSIHLQLKLKLSSRFWSHFISHFDPVLPQLSHVDFNANLCYIEIKKIYTFIDEVIIHGHPGLDIIFWRQWILSVAALFLILCFAYYPWFFFFFIQLALLIVFSTSYSLQTKYAIPQWKDKTKEFNLHYILHLICICFGSAIAVAINQKKSKKIKDNVAETEGKTDYITQTDDLDESDELSEPDIPTLSTSLSSISSQIQKQSQTLEEKDNDDEESIDMPKHYKFVVKRYLNVTERTEQLWFPQEILVGINELIIYIKDILQWKYVTISSAVVAILFTLCVASVLFRNTNFVKHQRFAILATILCFYSKPVQFLLWVGIGISYYYKNYYERYKQYKIDHGTTTPLRSDEQKSLGENKQKNYMRFMLSLLSLLTDLISGLIKFILKLEESQQNEIEMSTGEMYDPSKLCKISIIDYNSKYLCCDSNCNLVFLHANNCTDDERTFISIPITSNKIGLKWCNGNRYISAHSNGKIKIDKCKLFESEIFEIIEQDNGRKIALRSHHQKYLSSDKNIFASTQTSRLTRSAKYVIKLMNDKNDELTMDSVLGQDQLTTRHTYLFVNSNEKRKSTIIREQIIRHFVNDKTFLSLLAKLKSIKFLSF